MLEQAAAAAESRLRDCVDRAARAAGPGDYKPKPRVPDGFYFSLDLETLIALVAATLFVVAMGYCVLNSLDGHSVWSTETLIRFLGFPWPTEMPAVFDSTYFTRLLAELVEQDLLRERAAWAMFWLT